MKLQFRLYHCGYCEAKEFHAKRGGAFKNIKFYATFAHLAHPTKGHILFDAGYTQEFFEATRVFPFQIYAQMTKVTMLPQESAKAQLQVHGIQPEDVSLIIISHFHADHIGGLKDFPNARFVCSIKAFEDVKGKTGFAALSRGYIPAFLPNDFEKRVDFIDFSKAKEQDAILGPILDVFNDGSIRLCDLSGHAVGQMGALLNTERGRVFMLADAAWLKTNYVDMCLPNPIVRLFFGSWSDFKSNLKAIHLFHKEHPEVRIIPCHCEETMWEEMNAQNA